MLRSENNRQSKLIVETSTFYFFERGQNLN